MLDTVRVTHDFSTRTFAPASSATSPVAPSIPLRRLWWAAILFLGLATGAVGWTIWQLRTDATRAAISDSGNIAAVLAGQLARSLQSIDAVLLDIKKSAAERGID